MMNGGWAYCDELQGLVSVRQGGGHSGLARRPPPPVSVPGFERSLEATLERLAPALPVQVSRTLVIEVDLLQLVERIVCRRVDLIIEVESRAVILEGLCSTTTFISADVSRHASLKVDCYTPYVRSDVWSPAVVEAVEPVKAEVDRSEKPSFV